MSQPLARCQRTTASFRVAFHTAIASAGSAGNSMFCRPSAMRMSFSWVIPAMPSPSVRMKYRLVWISPGGWPVAGCDDGSNCGWV